jgi:hypothetical protein
MFGHGFLANNLGRVVTAESQWVTVTNTLKSNGLRNFGERIFGETEILVS